MMDKKMIQYAGRTIPVLAAVSCCVLGGGTAGTAAAAAAGLRGLDTLVIERGISLGGMQTLGLVEPFMPTFAPHSDTAFVRLVKERMRREGIEMSDGVTDFGWTNPETLAYVYDEILSEYGVRVLYQCALVDVIRTGAVLEAVVVQTVQGLAAVQSTVFIDATGDALLSRLAGVPVEAGYEKTGYNQPMSFRFEMGGIDLEALYEYIQSIHDEWCKTRPPYFEIAQARHRDIQYKLEPFFVQGIETGELTTEDAEYFQAFTIPGKPGCMSMNCPELPVRFRAVDAWSYSEGVRYGRAMIRRISRYLIRHLPGFSKAYVNKEASMLGARESFRIQGKYVMTEADYYARRRFADAVVRTAWYIDAHGEKVGEYLKPGEYYEIPYRTMVTEDIENLIVAGRCISVSFILEASMRIQPTCMSIGEAAGTAAAWAVPHGIAVNQLDWATIPPKHRSYVSDTI
jgi:hypothetical protein